jgi:hypothetical protein
VRLNHSAINKKAINESSNDSIGFWASVRDRFLGRSTSQFYKEEILRKGGQKCYSCGFTYPPRLIKNRDGGWYCIPNCNKVKTRPR